MKAINFFTILALALSINPVVGQSEELTLPTISKPSVLDEGTQVGLSNEQINELLPWAKNSKIYLIDLLDNIQGLTMEDKVERLSDGIKTVVGESSTKHSELLMRYILNRGLVVNEILNTQMDSTAVGSVDAKLRVLTASIKLSLKYFEIDMAIMTKKSNAPFVIFGLDYFEFLSELNKSIFDASAQYSIQRTALEWLQWDLYRDVNNASYASQIVKINNSLKTFTTKKLTDAQSIANIRLMKKIAEQLRVKDTLNRLEEARRLSAASSEEERRMLLAKSAEERERIQREFEVERLRGSRSAVDIEKVNVYSANLNSSSWSTRLEAVKVLRKIIGGDITLLLLNRFPEEKVYEVTAEIKNALNERVANNLSVMKAESSVHIDAEVYKFISERYRGFSWSDRIYMIGLISRFETLETYKLLLAWKQTENVYEVKNALTSAIARIETKIN